MFLNLSDFYKNKEILVLGGTGSIGIEIVRQLLDFNPKTIRILSNSENELWETQLKFKDKSKKLRFLLGDIRNSERVKRAVEGIDYIFNAAAVKHVPVSEYNPMEAINVNIHGLENIIEAAFEYDVKKVIHISTDKAVNPTTVMGATKMIGERLCISRGITKGQHSTIISCVRFGNVLGTRGSIVPLIKEQIQKGKTVTLTDEKMRRFFLSISDAVGLVLKTAAISQGGEISVLKMPTVLIKDLIEIVIEEYAPVVGKNSKEINIEIIGIRMGEKINEELISSVEFGTCYETEDMYIIYPNVFFEHDNDYLKKNGNKIDLNENFSYGTKNAIPLKKHEIKSMLKKLNLL